MTLIPISDVLKKTGASRGFIDANVRAGLFPAPLELGLRKRMWIAHEIEAWLQERATARRSYIEQVAV